MITRRHILLAGMATPVFWAGAACGAVPSQVVRPEDFGARGDGRTDDTAALQRCLELAPAGATVRLRTGAVYRIDTNYQPTRDQIGGLRLGNGQVLELNGAELRALPSALGQGSVVQGFRTSGWKIVGPGRIVGERMTHIGAAGEWGMGISAWTSDGWQIVGGVEVADCWGDGVYVGSALGGFCENFLVESVRVRNCRRNGISIVAGRNGEIRDCDIEKIDGTAPRGGIDLEPDSPSSPNRNIRISGGRIRDCGVGIYVTVANEGISISGVDIEGDNSGVIVSHLSNGVAISNCTIRSRIGGSEGGAIRTVGDPSKIVGLHIRSNRLSGGGYFVVDIFGEGYREVIVAGNEMRATNRGTQGIARVHNGTFTDNDCLIGAAAGTAQEYFLHLKGTTHGRNSYRNQSPHGMYAAIRGGRDLGGDNYIGPNLGKIFERL